MLQLKWLQVVRYAKCYIQHIAICIAIWVSHIAIYCNTLFAVLFHLGVFLPSVKLQKYWGENDCLNLSLVNSVNDLPFVFLIDNPSISLNIALALLKYSNFRLASVVDSISV